MKQMNIISKYIKDTCLEHNIDLKSSCLFDNEDYKKLKYKWTIYCPVEMMMTLDYFVEKYILSQTEIDRMKKGSFDINVSVVPKKLSINALCREIAKEDALINNGHQEDTEVIRQRFESQMGLKSQLRNKFDFDLDSFGGNSFKKLKLMKLLYRVYEKDNRLYDMLANPSLEGVDNSLINIKTVYGEIILMLKSEVAKEVDKEFIRKTKDTILNVVREWENIMHFINAQLFKTNIHEQNEYIERIDEYLRIIVLEIKDIKTSELPYNHSVFETFYLKLLKYEQLGREYDLRKIHNYVSSKDEIKAKYLKKYHSNLNEYINVKDLNEYIKKNINQIAELVYMKNDISKKEKYFLTSKSTIKQINNLVDIFNKNTKCNVKEEISILLIIAALQEIKSSKLSKETYEIKYYGYTKEHPALTAKLKQGRESREVYQLLWIRKICYRIYNNLGMNEEFNKLTSIERSIDIIISKILQYHNIEDIDVIQCLLTHKIDKLILKKQDYKEMFFVMKNIIYTNCNCNLELMLNAESIFIEIYRANLLEHLIKNIIKVVKQMEKEDIIIMDHVNYLEIVYDDIGTRREYRLLYHINLQGRLITLKSFDEKMNTFNVYMKRLDALGLSSLFNV